MRKLFGNILRMGEIVIIAKRKSDSVVILYVAKKLMYYIWARLFILNENRNRG